MLVKPLEKRDCKGWHNWGEKQRLWNTMMKELWGSLFIYHKSWIHEKLGLKKSSKLCKYINYKVGINLMKVSWDRQFNLTKLTNISVKVFRKFEKDDSFSARFNANLGRHFFTFQKNHFIKVSWDCIIWNFLSECVYVNPLFPHFWFPPFFSR